MELSEPLSQTTSYNYGDMKMHCREHYQKHLLAKARCNLTGLMSLGALLELSCVPTTLSDSTFHQDNSIKNDE